MRLRGRLCRLFTVSPTDELRDELCDTGADDLKAELKRIKQQTLAFCQRHGLKYTLTKSPWTQAHLKWLESLELERMERRIEELSQFETQDMLSFCSVPL